jgi:hypothetical protein
MDSILSEIASDCESLCQWQGRMSELDRLCNLCGEGQSIEVPAELVRALYAYWRIGRGVVQKVRRNITVLRGVVEVGDVARLSHWVDRVGRDFERKEKGEPIGDVLAGPDWLRNMMQMRRAGSALCTKVQVGVAVGD